MRRRQRRLRSWLRHERMTVAMALAEMTDEEYDAPRRQNPLLPSRSSSSCSKKSPAGRGPRLSLSLGRRSGYSEQLAHGASFAVPESQMMDQLVAVVIKPVDSVVPEQIIAVPKTSWPSRFPRTVLRETQKAEQLVEVPVPVPPSATGSAGRRPTGARVTRGLVATSLRGDTASPMRFLNTVQGPRRRPW